MGTQTEHLKLHQWESTDDFLREDFNEDNRKIDAAVGQVEGKADRALSGVENVGYNVYNLLLRDHYEGKDTGFKRALVFDGFRNRANISRLENARPSQNYLTLGPLAVAAGRTISTNNRQTATDGIPVNSGVTILGYLALELDGCGIMTELVFETDQEDGGSEYTYIVEQVADADGQPTDEVLATLGEAAAFAGAYGWTRLTLHPNLEVGNGLCMLRISATMRKGYGSSSKASLLCKMAGLDSGTDVYGPDKALVKAVSVNVGFTVQPARSVTTGMAESLPCLPEQAGGAAVAWVRHIGGSAALSLKAGDGDFQPMTAEGAVETVDLQGAACTEQSFRLDHIGRGALTVRVDCKFSAEAGMKVCDYGVILT